MKEIAQDLPADKEQRWDWNLASVVPRAGLFTSAL